MPIITFSQAVLNPCVMPRVIVSAMSGPGVILNAAAAPIHKRAMVTHNVDDFGKARVRLLNPFE